MDEYNNYKYTDIAAYKFYLDDIVHRPMMIKKDGKTYYMPLKDGYKSNEDKNDVRQAALQALAIIIDRVMTTGRIDKGDKYKISELEDGEIIKLIGDFTRTSSRRAVYRIIRLNDKGIPIEPEIVSIDADYNREKEEGSRLPRDIMMALADKKCNEDYIIMKMMIRDSAIFILNDLIYNTKNVYHDLDILVFGTVYPTVLNQIKMWPQIQEIMDKYGIKDLCVNTLISSIPNCKERKTFDNRLLKIRKTWRHYYELMSIA